MPTYVRTYVRTYVCVCMYVCMYVYVIMYVCMYVCTYIHTYLPIYLRIHSYTECASMIYQYCYHLIVIHMVIATIYSGSYCGETMHGV